MSDCIIVIYMNIAAQNTMSLTLFTQIFSFSFSGRPKSQFMRRLNVDHIGVIGRDVEVRGSTLGGLAGSGLFAGRKFGVGEAITHYDGYLTRREDYPRAGSVRSYDVTSDWVAGIRGTDFLVHGLTVPIAGRGGGSFSNHKRPPNAKFIYMRKGLNCVNYFGVQCGSHFLHAGIPCIILVAAREIDEGEEIFSDYGPTTCRRLGIEVSMLPHVIIFVDLCLSLFQRGIRRKTTSTG